MKLELVLQFPWVSKLFLIQVQVLQGHQIYRQIHYFRLDSYFLQEVIATDLFQHFPIFQWQLMELGLFIVVDNLPGLCLYLVPCLYLFLDLNMFQTLDNYNFSFSLVFDFQLDFEPMCLLFVGLNFTGLNLVIVQVFDLDYEEVLDSFFFEHQVQSSQTKESSYCIVTVDEVVLYFVVVEEDLFQMGVTILVEVQKVALAYAYYFIKVEAYYEVFCPNYFDNTIFRLLIHPMYALAFSYPITTNSNPVTGRYSTNTANYSTLLNSASSSWSNSTNQGPSTTYPQACSTSSSFNLPITGLVVALPNSTCLREILHY